MAGRAFLEESASDFGNEAGSIFSRTKNSIDFFEKPAFELCFGDSSTLKSALIAVLIAPRIRT